MSKSLYLYLLHTDGILNRSIQYDTPDPNEDPPSGDPTPADPDRTFTQKELNAIIAKERKSLEDKHSKALEDVKNESSTKLSELSAEMKKIKQEYEDSKLTDQEKEKKAQERIREEMTKRITSLQAEAEELKKSATTATETLKRERIEVQLGNALTIAKVLPQSHNDALRSFREGSEIEVDDNGVVTTIRYNDIPYTKIDEAAKAFLEDKFYFSAELPKGAGTRDPNGRITGGKPLYERSDEELIRLADLK